MKILYLVHQFYPGHYTGTEKVVLGIASMMGKMGHKVKVITYSFYNDAFYDSNDDGVLSKAFVYQGVNVLAVRHIKIPATINVELRDEVLGGVADKIVAREKPDIVHVGHLMRVGELLAAARRLAIPYVMTVTDFWLICPKFTLINSKGNLCAGPEGASVCRRDCGELPYGPIRKRLDEAKDVLLHANSVVAPTNFLAAIFREELPSLDLVVIGHGLRYGKLIENRRLYKPGNHITFCYCGTLTLHKGVHIAIAAVRKSTNDRVRLKIYGSGDETYTSHLKQMAGSDERIEFCGVYTEEEAAGIFATVDVIVVPSLWYETYVLVMREAMFCNLPVLASNVGVMADAMNEGVKGFTFKIGDSKDLSARMEMIVGDPGVLNRMKVGRRKIIVPSVEQEACAYEQVYRDVLSGRSVGGKA